MPTYWAPWPVNMKTISGTLPVLRPQIVPSDGRPVAANAASCRLASSADAATTASRSPKWDRPSAAEAATAARPGEPCAERAIVPAAIVPQYRLASSLRAAPDGAEMTSNSDRSQLLRSQ